MKIELSQDEIEEILTEHVRDFLLRDGCTIKKARVGYDMETGRVEATVAVEELECEPEVAPVSKERAKELFQQMRNEVEKIKT